MWPTDMFVQLGDKEIFLIGKSKAWLNGGAVGKLKRSLESIAFFLLGV